MMSMRNKRRNIVRQQQKTKRLIEFHPFKQNLLTLTLGFDMQIGTKRDVVGFEVGNGTSREIICRRSVRVGKGFDFQQQLDFRQEGTFETRLLDQSVAAITSKPPQSLHQLCFRSVLLPLLPYFLQKMLTVLSAVVPSFGGRTRGERSRRMNSTKQGECASPK